MAVVNDTLTIDEQEKFVQIFADLSFRFGRIRVGFPCIEFIKISVRTQE